jgi:ATP-dependent helicase YprA (DUF1998 family)
VIFDAVPGGAGYAQRMFDHLPEILRSALAVVEHCECGEETSCYACLRSYRNQPVHEEMSRGMARDVLAGLMS